MFSFFKKGPRVDVDVMMEEARRLINNGNKEQACKVLEALVKAKPEFGPAWHWLGATSLRTGDLVRAREALEKAKRLSPHNTEVNESLHRLQLIEDQAATAQRVGGSLIIGGARAKVGDKVINRRIREIEKAERDQDAPICRICKRRCIILPEKVGNSAVGVQCERCSTFYCSTCLDKMFRYTAVLSCLGCKASKVQRPVAGGEHLCEGFRRTHYKIE